MLWFWLEDGFVLHEDAGADTGGGLGGLKPPLSFPNYM